VRTGRALAAAAAAIAAAFFAASFAAAAAGDRAWAQRIVLKRSDFPAGWVTGDPIGTPKGKKVSCTAPSSTGIVTTARLESPRFDRKDGAAVSSTAVIVRTTAQARTLFRRYVRMPHKACFVKLWQDLKPPGMSVGPAVAEKLRLPVLPDRVAGKRVATLLTLNDRSLVAYDDLIFIQRSRAVTVILITKLGAELPASFEAGLARKVAARMKPPARAG
jgi:hypothetical protein